MPKAKTEHTQGPWKVRTAWNDDEEFEVYPTYGGKKAEFGRWAEIAVVKGNTAKQARANARIMASSLDLLQALKALMPSDFDEHPKDFAPEWHRARAVIAKVEPAKRAAGIKP